MSSNIKKNYIVHKTALPDKVVEKNNTVLRNLALCQECEAHIVCVDSHSGDAHDILSLVYDLNADGYHCIPFYREDLDIQGVAHRYFHKLATRGLHSV